MHNYSEDEIVSLYSRSKRYLLEEKSISKLD